MANKQTRPSRGAGKLKWKEMKERWGKNQESKKPVTWGQYLTFHRRAIQAFSCAIVHVSFCAMPSHSQQLVVVLVTY